MSPRSLLPVLALFLIIGCGGAGGGTATPPTTAGTRAFSYTDPSSGSYRLVKNPALSTTTHLVLDLTATGGTTGNGIAFTLTLEDPSRATWAKVTVADSEALQNGAVFTPGPSLALKGKALGTELAGVVGLKGASTSTTLNGVLARVALDLPSGATVGPCALSVPKAQVLLADGTLAPITIQLGTLAIN